MSVTVTFPALFSERLDGLEAVELAGETVRAALRALTDRYVQLAPLVWRLDPELNPVMAVFLNGRQLRAEELTAGYRFGPLYEPPSLEGTIAMPGILGGGNWGGAAFDPGSGFLFVKASEQPSLLTIGPANPETTVGDYALARGAPRSLRIGNVPISNPPWGTLTAIDMNAGEIVWQEPVGERPEVRSDPALAGVALPARLGVVAPPGAFVTAGGLVFLTGGSDVLYAFDAASGEVLWEARLPARGYANPMTFRTRGGRQLVVIATGGEEGAMLVAFGLPE